METSISFHGSLFTLFNHSRADISYLVKTAKNCKSKVLMSGKYCVDGGLKWRIARRLETRSTLATHSWRQMNVGIRLTSNPGSCLKPVRARTWCSHWAWRLRPKLSSKTLTLWEMKYPMARKNTATEGIGSEIVKVASWIKGLKASGK